MTQHTSLSPERWADFGLDQQLLMIGNEMNQAKRFHRVAPTCRVVIRLRVRVCVLLDLTMKIHQRSSLRRELLGGGTSLPSSMSNPTSRAGSCRRLSLPPRFTPVAARRSHSS